MEPRYYGAAAQYNRPKGFQPNKRLFLMIGLIVAVFTVIVIFFAVINSLAQGPRNEVARLIVRQQQLQTLITQNMKSLTNADVKKVSSEADIYLADTLFALQTSLGGEVPDTIVEEETDVTIAATLQEATQAGRFQETYVQLFKKGVASSLELAQKLKDERAGSETGEAAAKSVTSLTIIDKQLNALTP